MIYNGEICSGKIKRSREFVDNNGAEVNRINEWLGVFIYAGSLNVKTSKRVKFKKLVYRDEQIELYKCKFLDVDVWAMKKKENKDNFLVEILSTYNLRNKYKLRNGQQVTIEV